MTEPHHWQTPHLAIAAYLGTNNVKPDEVIPVGTRAEFRYKQSPKLTALLLKWERERRVLLAKSTIALDAESGDTTLGLDGKVPPDLRPNVAAAAIASGVGTLLSQVTGKPRDASSILGQSSRAFASLSESQREGYEAANEAAEIATRAQKAALGAYLATDAAVSFQGSPRTTDGRR